MPVAQRMIGHPEIKKHPQYVVEGSTPDTYGKTPADPEFRLIGRECSIARTNEPEFKDNKFGGYRDRQGKIKTREQNTLVISFRLTRADIADVLKWATATGTGAGTANESRTVVDSYLDNSGAEIYRVWRGVKPVSNSLNIRKEDPTMAEITCAARSYAEGAALGIPLGTGSLQEGHNRNAADLRFKDLGAFMYGDTELNYRQATITTTHGQRVQDSNGEETDLYREPTSRMVTGSVDIFKTGPALNEDARNGRHRNGYLVIDKRAGTADVSASARIPAAGANYIKYTSDIPGAYGNGLSVEYLAPAASRGAVSVEVDGNRITVGLANGGSTLDEIRDAVNNDPDAGGLVTAARTGAGGTSANAAAAAVSLAGGADHSDKLVLRRIYFLPSDDPLQGQDEATIESKSIEVDEIAVMSSA